jgi:hypothetical protein
MENMSDEYGLLQQRIREMAHELWQAAGSPHGEDDRFWFEAKTRIDREEAKHDTEAAGSSPASDSPASTVVTGEIGEAPATPDGHAQE